MNAIIFVYCGWQWYHCVQCVAICRTQRLFTLCRQALFVVLELTEWVGLGLPVSASLMLGF